MLFVRFSLLCEHSVLVARFISQILTKTLLGASSVQGHWGMSVITPHKSYLPTGD